MKIVDLPKSGADTIFEPSADQYFYITNSEISRLGGIEMAKSSLNDLSVFQMGYTNLWLMRRVLLLNPGEFRFEYEENLAESELMAKGDSLGRVGKYYLLGDQSYLFFAEREQPNHSKSFGSSKEAEDYLLSLQDYGANKLFAVARLLQDIYWH